MTAYQRIQLEEKIFNFLCDKGLVQEGRHYKVNPNSMGKVWDEQLSIAVVQSVLKIEEVL